MHVLDSSVWIYALTRTCKPAVELVEDVLAGDLQVTVDAYIFNEVVAGLERSGSDSQAISDAQTRFAEIVYRSESISEPTQRQVEQLSLDVLRLDDRTQLLGTTWGIQPKDVPVVVHAYSQPTDPTRIFTSDEAFSEFDPSAFGIEGIVLQYVDCSE